MLKKVLKSIVILGLLAGLLSCTEQTTVDPNSSANPSEPPAGAKAIIIADVSNNPTKKIKRFQPMADYLAKRLSKFDIGIGEVKVASDLQTITSWLKSGEVDIYFDSPYPAMRVSDQIGATPILSRWKGGQAEYYGIIFSMRDRGFTSLADLQGHVIGFDEISSTSGYMLPLAKLLDAGLKPVLKEASSADPTVAADEIGYMFSDDDENTIQWVISGKVAAGAVDIGSFLEIPEENRTQMTILAETDKVARHLVLLRPGMEPELAQTIKTILLEMDETPEGQAVLKQFEETAKFEDFPPEASLAKMRELYEQVQNQ